MSHDTRVRTLVAIDGTGGSGKSTVASLLSDELGLVHIDTGATYRLVALRALETDVPLSDADRVADLARSVAERTALVDGKLCFAGAPVSEVIRSPEVTNASSVVAAHPEVRRVLVGMQRSLVPAEGAVVEGRDIGTVVWPSAQVKVFLDADPDVRAQRRSTDAPQGSAAAEVLKERDARDANRPFGAMRPAPDAVVIDTTDRPPDQVARLVLNQLGHSVDDTDLVYRVVRGTTTALLRVVFRLDVRGGENVPARGAGIIAPNHRSLLDIPIAAAATTRRIRFMAKDELFRSPRAAGVLTRLGAYPVRRGKPDRSALTRSLQLLGDGELIGLFPEGTRRPHARFQELEEGLAYVALKSGAPVVPVAISGSEAVFPPDRKLPRLVKIRVRVGPPFTLGGPVRGILPRSRIRDATALARRRFISLIDELEGPHE